MHYDQYVSRRVIPSLYSIFFGQSFSFTGNPAIRALDPNYQDTMGQRHELTFNDIKKINYAYCGGKHIMYRLFVLTT